MPPVATVGKYWWRGFTVTFTSSSKWPNKRPWRAVSGLIKEIVALVIDSSSCSSIQSKLIPFFFLRGEGSNGDLPNHREVRLFQALKRVSSGIDNLFLLLVQDNLKLFLVLEGGGKEGKKRQKRNKIN